MSEREPRNIARIGQWAADRLVARLGSTSTPIVDEDYGAGDMLSAPASVTLASNDKRFITLFPETNVVTISSKNVDVTVRNAVPREARNGILVETQDESARVLFLRDGHVAVEILPPVVPQPLESPETADIPQNEEILTPPALTYPGASGDVETPSDEPSATPQISEQRERQPVTRFIGHLGANPHYDQTHDGKPRVNFPVGVNTKGEETTWKKVYTTGDYVARVQQAGITKGDRVRVTGFTQERPITKRRKDGTTYQVTEERTFALSVKKEQSSATPHPQEQAEGNQKSRSASTAPASERPVRSRAQAGTEQ